MPVYIGDRIRGARKAAGLTQRQLADKIKVSNTSVSNWEKGVSYPDPDTIQNLCWALDVEPNYFFNAVSERPTPPNFQPMPEMVKIPRVGRIACGQPITAEENIEGYDSAKKEWKADFSLVCVGDSMAPKIEDGDVVAIRIQPEVNNGEIAAVRLGEEATLKMVFLRPNCLELRPINPAYESIILVGEEMENVHIEGKAVGLCRNL